MKNQLTGEVVKSHAEHLILAKTEWEIAEHTPTDNRRTRLKNVVSDDDTDSDGMSSERELESESDVQGVSDTHSHHNIQDQPDLPDQEDPDDQITQGEEKYYSMSEDESEAEEEDMDTRQQLSRPMKRQRDGSSSEDDIPLAELSRRIKRRNERQEEMNAAS